MSNTTFMVERKGRRVLAAVFFFFAIAILLSGCVANDDISNPWAMPDPNDASVNLPGAFARP